MSEKKQPREPFELPEKDAIRLTRVETMAMEMFMASLSNLRYAKDDLASRLAVIPSGTGRMNMVIGQLSSLLKDVTGTIPDKQRRHLRNIAKDMEVRIVPKMTAKKVSVLLSEEEAKELINAAQWRCVDCVQECEESKSCKLRKLLEVAVPLETYDGFFSCPYARAEWEEDEP